MYNAENKLIRATVQEGNNVTVEEYTYDYAGRRTSKSTTTNGVTEYVEYLNENSALTNVLSEIDADGNEICYYTIGADLISLERSSEISYYLYDGHGTVRGLVDDNGEVTDIYTYDAFGNLLDKTGTTVNNYLYCGEQFDSATGLYYLRARYMNPETGTFITQDTYAGTIFDPTSLHKYLYASANPVMNIDPSGYADTVVELEGSMVISSILDEMASSAASFALNFYWTFKASLPVLVTAASSVMILIADSPAFMDFIARIANGDLSIYDLQREIQNLILKAQQFADQVSDFVNRQSSNFNLSGSSGNIPPNDPNFWEKVNEAISKVSNRYKGLGKCDQFKDAFTRELDKRGINYEIIKVESNYPKAGIFSDKYRGIIGETGYHYGVRVGDVVYDNLTTEGMNFFEWINDLGGSQYIHWH
ncbi:RHS repeat-associated core domain-containing protein [Methanobrevibacter sp.]